MGSIVPLKLTYRYCIRYPHPMNGFIQPVHRTLGSGRPAVPRSIYSQPSRLRSSSLAYARLFPPKKSETAFSELESAHSLIIGHSGIRAIRTYRDLLGPKNVK